MGAGYCDMAWMQEEVEGRIRVCVVGRAGCLVRMTGSCGCIFNHRFHLLPLPRQHAPSAENVRVELLH